MSLFEIRFLELSCGCSRFRRPLSAVSSPDPARSVSREAGHPDPHRSWCTLLGRAEHWFIRLAKAERTRQTDKRRGKQSDGTGLERAEADLELFAHPARPASLKRISRCWNPRAIGTAGPVPSEQQRKATEDAGKKAE